MNDSMTVVEKRISLTPERAERLSNLARVSAISEDDIMAKALDILFSLTELLNERLEERGWSFMSEASLQRVWDNEDDAAYDNWREMYGISTR